MADRRSPKDDGQKEASARSTVGGPSSPKGTGVSRVADKVDAAQQLSSKFVFNENKADEYGGDAQEGRTAHAKDPLAGASTVSEANGSEKTGSGGPPIGANETIAPLDRVRVDSTDKTLTTNQGVPVADNQNSLKAGLRGPTLLEDFILREKITHFDHERIPERIVHARGSAAHGYFECYKPLTKYTRAGLFSESGKQTPVFVRFSTVVGERGSADTARDVRGFAVKFYTEEGNWDLVGNNIPVFFIQDAIKFPDLIHAAKPEPHFGMPQAATAHDTFWDFVSLMPESTAMLLWVMSDRAIPRSYRTMQGFGVHTFRLVNEAGESHFVKFHWTPRAGTHSLVWDEAVKISGADPDFHRRDLWEAIEAGAYPEWELGLQIFTEAQAEKFSFDVLDATKFVPEELVPVVPVGKLILNRNPDNFFSETEQVAFCTAHIVPGIDFTNDPLLAGRIHSYVDTQISRLGGPNFHEIPINAPIAQVHNNQRDGMHRQAINRGRVSYEPNSLAGGCPFQAGTAAGFTSFRGPVDAQPDKIRGKSDKFGDHYTQATLFWDSQSEIEKRHIIKAFRFELSRVQVPAIRERMVSGLLNVAPELGEAVAQGLGLPHLPDPMPKVLDQKVKPEIVSSKALSLFARPGDRNIVGRRVAVLAAEGLDVAQVRAFVEHLTIAGAVPKILGAGLGRIGTERNDELEIDGMIEAIPSVLFDGVLIPGGEAGAALTSDGHAAEFIKDQYRHCKPILVFGDTTLLEAAAIPLQLPEGENDPGIIIVGAGAGSGIEDFVTALAAHRHFARESDPPRV